MTTDTTGTVLRRGTVQGFAALEVDGKSVLSAAASVRQTIQDKLGQGAADCFAQVHVDDNGKRFDWFTPLEGKVKPWVAASPAECSRALAQLEALKQQLSTTARSLEAEQPQMAEWLRKALHFPGSDCVYLVDGKPVITFWGFAVTGAENLDPLRYLRQLPTGSLAALAGDLVPPPPPAPAPIEEPSVAPPPVPIVVTHRPSPLRWLGWLLLLLFLLLVLFLALRTFRPDMKLPWGLSDIHLPWLTVKEEPVVQAPKPVVEEAKPEPVVEVPKPEPVVKESKPEPEPEPKEPPLSLDALNGRWWAEEALIHTRTNRSTGKVLKETKYGLELVFQNGVGKARALNGKVEACRKNRVTASIGKGMEDSDVFLVSIGKMQCSKKVNDRGSQDMGNFICLPLSDGADMFCSEFTVNADGSKKPTGFLLLLKKQ